MTTLTFNPPTCILPNFGNRSRVFTYPQDLTDVVIEANEARIARHAKRAEHLEPFADTDDHFPQMMHYDLELAPNVTGRELLLCHGIVPVPPQELKSGEAVYDELWTIVECLALNGVFLLNTDHLSDSELYARMYYCTSASSHVMVHTRVQPLVHATAPTNVASCTPPLPPLPNVTAAFPGHRTSSVPNPLAMR